MNNLLNIRSNKQQNAGGLDSRKGSSTALLRAQQGPGSGEKGTGLNNSRAEGSLMSSQQNLDNNNMISENTNSKKKKRFKLEEQKELRIQEFLAAKRKEYEKYVSLDFDYKIVEEELKRIEIIDYQNVDKDEERKRIRTNKMLLIQDRMNLYQNGNERDSMMDGGGDEEGVGVQKLIELMRVYITPLQDNFSQSDENFKNIPAKNMDHFLLGPPKFCGSVFRKMNDKCINEEVWVVVRGFYVFLYINIDSMRPICMLRIPLNKIGLEVTKGIDTKERGQKVPVEFQYFTLAEKAAQSVHFFIGKKSDEFKNIKNNFYEYLKKQVAIKTYLFLCGYLNTAPDQNLVRFYESDDSTILKVNLETEILDNMAQVHPILKPISEAFFYYTFIVAAASKNLMIIDFSDLCLWSNFLIFFFSVMKEENVNCLLRVLKLDNNDITDEVLLAMLDYFKKPQSFFITHFSMNRIADLSQTSFMYIGRIISERHICIRDSTSLSDNYQLPFQYLSLNDIKMSDIGLSNIVINLEKVHKDNIGRELHIARNDLTESSLRSLGNLLETFQGISVLNISESYQIKSIQKEYFFQCLKNNYSLTTLNISRIDMNIESFKSLISLLEDNFTLQTIQITLTEFMVQEIARSKNINLLKYFMISYNPQLVFENA